MLKFTQDHEWLRIEQGIAVIGITEHAQQQLGDIVFVALPSVGATFARGAAVTVVESVKAASEVYAPIGGEIVEVNQDIVAKPALINSDPMGKGWFFKMKINDRSQLDSLLDESAYRALIT
jgi:glycine cleavage system H protein